MCEQGGFVGKARPVTCSSAVLPSPPERPASPVRHSRLGGRRHRAGDPNLDSMPGSSSTS